jgi:molybdopterin molybdotransferase
MLTVEQALKKTLASVRPLPAVSVPVGEAAGSVAAGRLRARTDLPPFTNSAVDGFAVREADVRGASPSRPARLRLGQTVWAGGWPLRGVRRGECARVATGAPVPSGADAVVMQEDARPGPDGTVRLLRSVRRGDNLRRKGDDVRRGDVVVAEGRRLRPADALLAAAAGHARIPVRRAPRVAIVSTGDELQPARRLLGRGRIYDGNAAGLSALVKAAGARVVWTGLARDRGPAVRGALRRAAAKADVVLASGGVSVGERDHVRTAFHALGFRERLWRVAMKPGRPLAVFRRGRKVAFGLPGNPVSAFVTFLLFVRPALALLSGGASPLFRSTARLAESVERGPRRQYLRGVRFVRLGRDWVRSAGGQGSHAAGALARADCLYVVPEGKGRLPRGAPAAVIPLEF